MGVHLQKKKKNIELKQPTCIHVLNLVLSMVLQAYEVLVWMISSSFLWMNASFDRRNDSHPLRHVLARPRNDPRHPHRFHSPHYCTTPIHVDNVHDQMQSSDFPLDLIDPTQHVACFVLFFLIFVLVSTTLFDGPKNIFTRK